MAEEKGRRYKMSLPKRVDIYDTTLRDGAQAEGISFTVEDKLKITEKLDDFGVQYIEGGWPGSNPKDSEYFDQVRRLPLKRAKVAAFGSTRRAERRVEGDENLQALLRAETEVVTVFGKSWDFHVTKGLRTTLDENLRMVYESVAFFKKHGREVVFDAEHFFDGFKHNPDYALEVLKAAEEAGADVIVLCDTNGGAMPWEVAGAVREAREEVSVLLGIHAHNDGGLAVANSTTAVIEGVSHVQGTINGYGERCGNADLCAVIPNLKLKLGVDCISDEDLRKLRDLSYFVSEVANMSPDDHRPFVGRSAFAHKGGVHVSAVLRHPRTYEHIEPEKVGNERRFLVSELSGGSSIVAKACEMGLKLDKDSPVVRSVLREVKRLESMGYHFEGAEGSLELLLRKETGQYRKLFDVLHIRVIVEKRGEEVVAEATLKLKVGEKIEHTVGEGDGPVHALDNALRKALEEHFPELKDIRLTDFKVRVVDSPSGTAAKVRVLIESRDKDGTAWTTIGLSTNIIEASWQALWEGIEYGLLRRRGWR